MANSEYLAILKEGVEIWNSFRHDFQRDTSVEKDLDLSGVNLSEVCLNGVDFREADLSGANLRGADLGGADLRGASLIMADLRGANLSGVDLSGVDLRGADLGGADFRGANLSGADLRNVSVGQAHWDGADLSGALIEVIAFAEISSKLASHQNIVLVSDWERLIASRKVSFKVGENTVEILNDSNPEPRKLSIFISDGDAPPELITQLFLQLDALYQKCGGSGLKFTHTGNGTLEPMYTESPV